MIALKNSVAGRLIRFVPFVLSVVVGLCRLIATDKLIAQDLLTEGHVSVFRYRYITLTDSADYTFDFRTSSKQSEQRAHGAGFAQYKVFIDTTDSLPAMWFGDSTISVYGRPLYQNPVGDLVACENPEMQSIILQNYRSCAWDTLLENVKFVSTSGGAMHYSDGGCVLEIPLAMPPAQGYEIRIVADSLRFSHNITNKTEVYPK